MSAANGAPSGGVQSVDRAVRVLEILARDGNGGVSEVAAEIGVHKSTAFRLLSALEDRGLVEQDGERGKYRLGFGVLRLANAVHGRLDVVRQAGVVLAELAADVGETVNLAVLRAHYAVNVDEARGAAAVSVQNWTGQLTPLHATSSGKILLAHCTPEQRKLLLDAGGMARFTPRTVVNRRVLSIELDQVVTDGYATAFGEYEAGLNAIAAPVYDHAGMMIAALSVSGPAYRLGRGRIADIIEHVHGAAGRVSTRMGHLG